MATPLLHRLRELMASQRGERVTDGELLRRFTDEQDEKAFAALVDRHGAMVLRVGGRVLPVPDAEDIFQATFLLLARKAASLRGRDSLAGWLHEVAYRLSLKARLMAARRRTHEGHAPVRSPPDPLAEITLREARTLFEECLDQLPEKYRELLVLCHLECLTQEEAAQALGCSRSTVKRRLEQGRDLLRQRLARRGLGLGAGLLAAVLTPAAGAGAVPKELAMATLRVVLSGAPTSARTGLPSVVALLEGELARTVPSWLRLVMVLVLAVGVVGISVDLLARPLPGQGLADAGEKEPARQDRTPPEGAEEPLPPGARARMGTGRFRPGEIVYSVALSPDGKVVAGGSYNSAVRLWDTATGKEMLRLDGHRWNVYLAFAPDGKMLAAGSQDGCVRLWDAKTGKLLRQLFGNAGVCAVAFAPDGKKLVSADRDGAVHVWGDSPFQELVQCRGHRGAVWSVAFSPDGKTVGTAGADRTVRLWETSTGKELRTLEGHTREVKGIAFSPNGKTIASSGADGTIRLWDVSTGKEVRRLAGHVGSVDAVTFLPDGKTLVSGGNDNTIRFWDVTGKELTKRRASQHGVLSLSVAADGKLLASGGWDGVARLWDPTTGKELRRTAGHQNGIFAVGFVPDGRTLLTASADGTARLWRADTGKEASAFEGHKGGAWSVAFDAERRLLAAKKNEDRVALWEVASGKELRQLVVPRGRVLSVAIAPSGKRLAVGTEVPNEPLKPGEVTLWDAQGKLLHRCQGHEGGVRCLAFSGEGKLLVSGSYDKTIRLWDTATGKTLRLLTGHEKGVERVVFSPDGRLLASGANETVVRLWEVATGKELRPLKGHSGVLALAFSPDGRTLATAGMTPVIRLWELSTGKERAQFVGHHGVVLCLSFSAGGRALASGGGDTTALVWDVSGGAAGRRPAALTPAALASAWQALLDADAATAGRALWTLASSPKQAVSFLREHLRPTAAVDARRVAKLLADLDSDRFAVRERATNELGKMGSGVVPHLRKALEGRVSTEASRRLNRLLEKLQGPGLLAEQGRERRAVEALEHIGTAEARPVLEALAKGEPESELTKEAKASLERLRRRPPPAP